MDRCMVITPGMCDFSGRLSIADTFGLFMDIAAQHAEEIGVGMADMSAKGQFWLTVQTCVNFIKRPKMMQKVMVSTWPEEPEKLFMMRYYRISSGNEIFVEGKTKWAVLDVKSGRIIKLNDGSMDFPCYSDEKACEGEEIKINENFEEDEKFASYTIRSTDIDVGNHMNNVAYVRALMGAFSTEEQRNMKVSRLEVSFRKPCFENETLSIYKRKTDEGIQAAMIKEDGSAAFLVRLVIK